MLNEFKVHPTLPAVDLERARGFYRDKLGFVVETENPAAVMFSSAGGTRFTVFATSNPNRAGHTQAGWEVKNIEAVVQDLRGKDVLFEEYDYPNLKTVNGVAETPAGKAAWFKDTEGNLLGLVQLR
ncbi:MAG TPA: VOC family protein [Acidimicrobiia bacterium]|jgi:catechol 2,3-dioxygenase-like lactoylglutathione lyase family enzyme